MAPPCANVLLLHKPAPPVFSELDVKKGHAQRDIFGVAEFQQQTEIELALKQLNLPVHGELTGSSGYRSLVQASTVPPPPVRIETSW
jgi:hypothetical protein